MARPIVRALVSMLLFVLCVLPVFAAENAVSIPQTWQFRLDPGSIGAKERWQSRPWPTDGKRLKVGDPWETQGIVYDGLAWYRTEVTVPAILKGRQAILRFGAVDEDAWVYLNGHFAGHHTGWAGAFEIDVTPWVKCGAKNVLVVRVQDTLLMGGICGPVTFATPAPGQERPFVQRLRKEGVRLTHLCGTEGSSEAMGKAGCNTVMLQTWSLSGVKKTTSTDSDRIVQESDLQRLRNSLENNAQRCKQANQVAFATFYGMSEVEAALLKQHKYELLVDADGRKAGITPCPLSRRYWFGLILPQFLKQANTLHGEGIAGGAIVDLEYYSQEVIFPWDWGMCYCSDCWSAFCRETAQDETTTSLQGGARSRWVRRSGLLQDYTDLAALRLTALMREMAQECYRVHPDFLLGYYPYVPNWYCDALLRGWGTPETPALAMSESEFVDGFRPWSEDRINHVRSQALNALYIGALWQGTCYPESYAAKAEELARRTDGYWLYYSAMFFIPEAANKFTPPDRGTEYTLTSPPKQYIDALAKANARLDEDRSLETSFPGKIDLTSRLKRVGGVKTAAPIKIENSGFENGAKGWSSIHPVPFADSRFAHSGKRSLRFDAPEGVGRGLLNITQPVKLGAGDYTIRLWARYSGPGDGAGLGMMIYCDGPGGAIGHYFPLQNIPRGQWTRLTRQISAPEGCKSGTLSIHSACPAATVWIDDVEILPAGAGIWETGPVQLPAGVRFGKLLWEANANAELTVTVHAADERLQWGQESGLHMSRLDSLSDRKFVFRITYDGAAPTGGLPVKRLWLETSKKL